MSQKFLFATCVTHDTSCDLPYSRHSTPQHWKSTKIEFGKQHGRWYRRFNCWIEGSNSKYRKIELTSKKEKSKKKFKRRSWFIHYVRTILILFLKNLSHQKIQSGTFWWYVLLLPMMDEVYPQPFLHKLSNNWKLISSFIRIIYTKWTSNTQKVRRSTIVLSRKMNLEKEKRIRKKEQWIYHCCCYSKIFHQE